MNRPISPAVAALIGLAGFLGPQPAAARAEPAVERGAYIAQRDCAFCHAVGRDESSPNSKAPSFVSIRLRFNPIALERRLHPMPAQGHDAMPPRTLSPDDVSNVVAYIESLEPSR